MTLDTRSAGFTFMILRPIAVAVTTVCDGRTNGLMAASGGGGGIIPEAPRAQIGITKYNMTHDMIMKSGVFAFHVLAAAPDDILQQSLNIMMSLSGRSGREGDKMGGLNTRPGVLGVPILTDALTYVEAKVVKALDADENTIFIGDVVAAETLRKAPPLDIPTAWANLPKSWVEAYGRDHVPQMNHARACRGLPPLDH